VKPAITLALTAHEPHDRLAGQVEALLPTLAGRYAALTAFCSRQTHPTVLDLLRRGGVRVEVDEDPSTGMDRMGDVRRRTIRGALNTGTSHIQLCDFDRAFHWIACYPDELEAVIADIPNYDLLVLGRTARAWTTYPLYQAETEPLFNRVFELATGLRWDVGAGSRGLSRRAAESLLEASHEPGIGVDAEWPLLLLRQPALRSGHRECEGTEFETADRFGPEIEAAGSYPAGVEQMSADPRRWVFRLRVALQIADAVVRYGPMPRADS
jgi:hypothetical protein